MGVFSNFPYTNFHELNQDWIIEQVRKVMDEWNEYRADMNLWKQGVDEQLATFQAWFDNLDVQDEVRVVINELIRSGEFLRITSPQITSTTEAWLEEHITPTTPVVDASLTVSGAAADAAKTGELIFGIEDQLRGTNFDKRIVRNSYVTNTGVISAYNGWDRTDYLLVEGLHSIKVKATSASRYNVFYDSNKNKIPPYGDYGTTAVINIVAGTNEVLIPPDAKWVIFSGERAFMENLVIEVGETISELEDAKQIEYIQTDLNGKQVYVTDLESITLNKIINNDGSESDSAYDALTDYIPIRSPENKYDVFCEGFVFYVVQYRKNPNDSFTWKNTQAGAYSQSGTGFYMNPDTTHVRIGFRMASASNLTPSRAEMFCNAFVLRETRDINKYLRICTWNQNANGQQFQDDTRAEVLERRLNYLKILGEYDPDVICAQEAVGDYFTPTSLNIESTMVFHRKYRFTNYPGASRRNWIKYQYTRAQRIAFVSQDPTETERFYTKMLLQYEGYTIAVLNTHCTFGGGSDFEKYRKGQFEELLTEMQNNEFCILCGDFNAYRASEFDLFKNAGMRVANCGDFGQFDTWDPYHVSTTWPFSALDNIITTNNFFIQNVIEGPYNFEHLSDHKALFVDLQIRQ